jgi:hypothetical protein
MIAALCGAVFCAFAATGSLAATDAAKTGNCSPTAGKYMVSGHIVSSTTGSTFVAVPQARVTFTQGAKGCVKVTFVGQVGGGAPVNGQMQIRAMLDGVASAESPIGYFDNTVDGAQSYVFIFANVAAGPHTVTMEYTTNRNTDTGRLIDRTTFVEYTK